MEIFNPTLNQMLYLFLFILIGFLLAHFKIVNKDAAGILGKFENTVFIPALVMGTFINNFKVSQLNSTWKIMVFSLLLELIIIPLSFLLAKICTKDKDKQKIYTYGLGFSNFSFMGNAIVKSIFPDIFMEYIIFTLVLWAIIYIWAVPSLLVCPENGAKMTFRQRLRGFANPMFVCMIIGMIIGLFEIQLPTFVTSVIDAASSCMSPVAMILTGITVAGISFKKVFADFSVYMITFFRLIAIPFVFMFVLFGLAKFLPITETMLICAVCSIAMPLGLNTIVIPSAYGKDTTSATAMALVSHTLSVITIPIVFMVLQKLLSA